MLFAHRLHECRNVDFLIVGDRGECPGAVTLGGEMCETAFFHPLMNEGIVLSVALVAVRKAFLEDGGNHGIKSLKEGDGRGGGCVVLAVVPGELQEIEIVSPVGS